MILIKAGSWEEFDVQTYVHDHGSVLPETVYCAHYVECGREHVAKEAGKLCAEYKACKVAAGAFLYFLFCEKAPSFACLQLYRQSDMPYAHSGSPEMAEAAMIT